MIGTDLNLTLPSGGETMAVNIARTAEALSAIEDSLAEKATPAALNINAPLELNGNSLTEVASVQFASGNLQNTAGSMYYYGDDWYLVDAVGTIQITDNGQLNAAGIGGIGGDYGGVNPAAVTYVDASGQYVFTDDTGDYSDLVANALILQGAAGTLTIGVDAALAGVRAINVKTLVGAGTALMVYDASDSSLSSTNTIPTPTAPDYKYTSARTKWIPLAMARDTVGTHTYSQEFWTISAGSTNPLHIPVVLEDGERITGWTAYFTKANTTDGVVCTLFKAGTAGSAATVVGVSQSNTTTSGAITLTQAGLTEDVASSSYTFRINRSANLGLSLILKAICITITRP